MGRQIFWTSVPIWSIGFLSSLPFLFYAVDRRRGRDWAVFAGYNHVPAAVLMPGLGLSEDEMRDVLTARRNLGRFTNADELCAYTPLSPDRIDELRDLMIFT